MELCIEIAGDRVRCKQDGKEVLAVALADFLAIVAQHSEVLALPDVIPEGVRFLHRRGEAVVLVMEEKPQTRTVRWLADNSPVPYGPGAVYCTARLAFPFIVIIVALRGGALTGYQQCFYRTAPVQRLDDPLFFPNLYNVAKGYRQQCWLCLANLRKNLAPLAWEEKVREIRTHLWGAGFNQSSEVHEGNSYWQTMRSVDPRLSSLTMWEAESKKDSFFPLTVKWQPVGKTVGEVVNEMLSAVAPPPVPPSVEGLSQLLNLCPTKNGTRRKWLLPFHGSKT